MIKKHKVLVTDTMLFPPGDPFECERKELSKIGAELILARCRTEDEVIQAARGVDAVLNIGAPVSKKVIDSLNNCKVIVRYGVGVDTVDIESATEKGIPVVNIPAFCIEEVSTMAITLLLACARKIVPFNNSIKKGIWDRDIAGEVHSLKGRVLGLIGFGKIAKATARKAKAFDLNIITYDPYISRDDAEEKGAKLVDLDELLRSSDYISVHVPLTKETKHLLGEDEFKMMKKSTFFVNTSRGPVVDEKALYKALKEGWIAGAGLDVVEKEPIEPENSLLKLDNVIFTPHVSSGTKEAFIKLRTIVAQEAVRVLSGKLPVSLVNPEVKDKDNFNLNNLKGA